MEENEVMYDEILLNKYNDIINGLDKEDMFELIQTQKEHIDVLIRIIMQIQKELIRENKSIVNKDYEEITKINNHIIKFIEEIIEEEMK